MSVTKSFPFIDSNFPGIYTTVRTKRKTKDFTVKVDLDGARIAKRQLKDGLSSEIQFDPPWYVFSSLRDVNTDWLRSSIGGASILSVQLCQSHFIRETAVLAGMEFTVRIAEEILGDLKEVNGKAFVCNLCISLIRSVLRSPRLLRRRSGVSP